MPHLNARVVRRSTRALLVAPAVLLPLLPTAALATAPEAWPDPEPVSAMDFVLILLLIPLGLALVIAALSYAPSLVRGGRYTPGRAWRAENQWFGGPKDGLEAADRSERPAQDVDTDRGGASARW